MSSVDPLENLWLYHNKWTIESARPHSAWAPNHTHCRKCTCTLYCNSMIPCKGCLRSALLWQLYICLWGLCNFQRTHAKQCQGWMLLYTRILLSTTCTRDNLLAASPLQHPTTKHTSALFPQLPPQTAAAWDHLTYNVYKSQSPGSTPASTTAAWTHLRTLIETLTTPVTQHLTTPMGHWSPDLGEGSKIKSVHVRQ